MLIASSVRPDRIERGDGHAVADHGDGVGDVAHLIELVRNDDACDALRLEFQHQIQQFAAVIFLQRGGGFVEDQQFDVLGQCLCDLDQLLLADADGIDLGCRRFVEADLGQQFFRAPVGLVPVDDTFSRTFVAQEDVLGDRQLRDQREFLVNDDDAAIFGIANVPEPDCLALEQDVPVIGSSRVDAGQDLHER
jgi:hypothetical protein